jgi:hypothetical protein
LCEPIRGRKRVWVKKAYPCIVWHRTQREVIGCRKANITIQLQNLDCTAKRSQTADRAIIARIIDDNNALWSTILR